jgi:uncharacterized protein (UPF0212 family)
VQERIWEVNSIGIVACLKDGTELSSAFVADEEKLLRLVGSLEVLKSKLATALAHNVTVYVEGRGLEE